MKPFSVPVKFPFSVKKNIRILDLDPRSEAYCLSLNSVCFKRLPRKKYFHLYVNSRRMPWCNYVIVAAEGGWY